MSGIAGTQLRDETRHVRRGLLLLRAGVATFALCAVAFLAGFAAFVDHVAHLKAPLDLHDADGIVVLTGGQSRIGTGLNLLEAGKAERLLISGVNPIAKVDDLRLATGSDSSLFACCVDIDRAALNTIGNAEESAKWAIANTYGSIIVVTNNYHIPRSLLEMRRILPTTELQPYPVVNAPLTDGAWLAKSDALRVLLIEYSKYLAALARGLLPTWQEMQPSDQVRAAVAGK